MSNDKRKVYVVGHKNPDTDSICTAIAYANLKTKLTQIRHEPRRAGQLNEETQYVLERFGVKVPLLLSDLREQIKDVDLRESEESVHSYCMGKDDRDEYAYTSYHKRRDAGRCDHER